jgi:hypothetical protein
MSSQAAVLLRVMDILAKAVLLFGLVIFWKHLKTLKTLYTAG